MNKTQNTYGTSNVKGNNVVNNDKLRQTQLKVDEVVGVMRDNMGRYMCVI